jgi:5'(3')-deoxyribonucleotidase
VSETNRTQLKQLRSPTTRGAVGGGEKKVLYLDMDNVLVDFESGLSAFDARTLRRYAGKYDEIPGIFSKMQPMRGAIEAYSILRRRFDTYIASTAPWENPTAWADKRDWIDEHLGAPARKRLILTHHKDLLRGDFIVDDRTKRGVDRFKGKHIHFGTKDFPDWDSVVKYLVPRA